MRSPVTGTAAPAPGDLGARDRWLRDHLGPRAGVVAAGLAVMTLLSACAVARSGADGDSAPSGSPSVAAVPSTNPVLAEGATAPTLSITDTASACGEADTFAETDDSSRLDAPVGLADTTGSSVCLGPALVWGRLVERAGATLDASGRWVVQTELTGDGIDLFNRAAALCFDRDVNLCPTGRLALLLDGRILSAPSVEAASFTRDQIEISGQFTEDEAVRLADALTSGPLVLRPVVLDAA